MESYYEYKAEKRKAWSTIGYGLMWLFAAVLVGVLPFLTGNESAIFYLTGGLSAVAGVYKLIKGIRHLLSLN